MSSFACCGWLNFIQVCKNQNQFESLPLIQWEILILTIAFYNCLSLQESVSFRLETLILAPKCYKINYRNAIFSMRDIILILALIVTQIITINGYCNCHLSWSPGEIFDKCLISVISTLLTKFLCCQTNKIIVVLDIFYAKYLLLIMSCISPNTCTVQWCYYCTRNTSDRASFYANLICNLNNGYSFHLHCSMMLLLYP